MVGKKEKQKILQIAEPIRRACQEYVDTHEKYGDQLDAWESKDLDCFCAIAATFLAQQLKHTGLPVEIAQGEFDGFGHAWVRIHTTVVDLTKTQFDSKYPPVFIGNNPKWYRKQSAAPPDGFKELFREWPKGQKPTVRRLQYLNRILRGILKEKGHDTQQVA